MSYRFAIIGCGHIAQRHAHLASRYGELVAVCDSNEERAREMGLSFGASVYTDSGLMLRREKIDIACICSPNGWHDVHSIEALNSGAHVLCEKPMALTVEKGKAMLDRANATGKKLFVVKQNRFNPPVALLKNMLLKGELGKILGFQVNCFWNRDNSYYQNPWKGTLQWDGGTLFTQFSHFIDLIHWFFGDLGKAIGYRENTLHQGVIEFEDQGAVLLEMESGVKGTLHYSINAHKKNMEGSCTVFGDQGTCKIGGPYLNRIDHFEVEHRTTPLLEPAPGPNQYGTYEGSMSNHDKVYEQLIRELNDKEDKLVDAAEALKTITMIEKIYAASPMGSLHP